METRLISPLAFLCLLSAADAALLAYDGFDSTVYKATPTAAGGGYQNPSSGASDALFWDSDTTYNNPLSSTEVGQNPSIHGFSGAWRYGSASSAGVYGRLEGSQLSYAGLTATTSGQLNLQRNLSTSGTSRTFSRTFNVGPSTGFGGTLYIGGLIQRTSGTTFSFSANFTDGSNTRNFGMTVALDGSGTLTGTDATAVTSGSPIWGNATPEFFILKLENSVLDGASGGTLGDQMTLYINPDLTNEAASTPSLVLGDSDASFFVTANSAWSLGTFTIGSSLPSAGQSLIFDEFKVGTQWADMLSVIPEPGTGALALVSLMLLARRRR